MNASTDPKGVGALARNPIEDRRHGQHGDPDGGDVVALARRHGLVGFQPEANEVSEARTLSEIDGGDVVNLARRFGLSGFEGEPIPEGERPATADLPSPTSVRPSSPAAPIAASPPETATKPSGADDEASRYLARQVKDAENLSPSARPAFIARQTKVAEGMRASKAASASKKRRR